MKLQKNNVVDVQGLTTITTVNNITVEDKIEALKDFFESLIEEDSETMTDELYNGVHADVGLLEDCVYHIGKLQEFYDNICNDDYETTKKTMRLFINSEYSTEQEFALQLPLELVFIKEEVVDAIINDVCQKAKTKNEGWHVFINEVILKYNDDEKDYGKVRAMMELSQKLNHEDYDTIQLSHYMDILGYSKEDFTKKFTLFKTIDENVREAMLNDAFGEE